MESSHARVYKAWSTGIHLSLLTGHSCTPESGLIEKRVDHPNLSPENIAGVTALDFFLSVETFQPDAELFTELPDQVQTAVKRFVISIWALRGFVIDVDITQAQSGPEVIVPTVGITSHQAEVRQGR